PAAGGASRTVTKNPGHYVEPRFSPDGSGILYRRVTGGYFTSGAWSQDPGIWWLDLGHEPKLLSRSGSDAHFGALPDRVFFSDTIEETQLVLKSVNLEGVDVRTHLKGAQATEFRVSPDGRWVAFTENWNA